METITRRDEQTAVKPTQRINLTGRVNDWTDTHLDIDALIAPLGLSGRFAVRGIYHEYKEVDDFYLVLTPKMTALHVTRAIALEYERLNGDEAYFHWTECLDVNVHDGWIYMAFGS